MPLKSTYIRTIHKNVLTWFVGKSFWFDYIQHYEVFLHGD